MTKRESMAETIATAWNDLQAMTDSRNYLSSEVARLTNEVNKLRAPRWTLLKFYGYKDGRRELFDANAIEHSIRASFPITEGYDSIEVWTEELQ